MGGRLKYLRVDNIFRVTTWVDPVLTFNISGLIPFNSVGKKPCTETTAVPFFSLPISKVHATQRLSLQISLRVRVQVLYIYWDEKSAQNNQGL